MANEFFQQLFRPGFCGTGTAATATLDIAKAAM